MRGRLTAFLVTATIAGNTRLLYVDKLVIIFNYKNEPITISTTDELNEVEKISDTEAFASPNKGGCLKCKF